MTIPSVFPVFVLIGFIKKPPSDKYCCPNTPNKLSCLSLKIANLVSVKVTKEVNNLNSSLSKISFRVNPCIETLAPNLLCITATLAI